MTDDDSLTFQSMTESVLQFYDRLSGDFHLLFEDWKQTVRSQGEVLDRLLRSQFEQPPSSVLDCCCGIGTQAIALALRGYQVQATDLSASAVDRARREAEAFGVSITFGVADVRGLTEKVAGTFDVVLACDNALPHLLDDQDLQQAVDNMAAKIRPGGLFLASIRDYDQLVRERQRATPVRVFDDPGERRLVFQVWTGRPTASAIKSISLSSGAPAKTGTRLISPPGTGLYCGRSLIRYCAEAG
jgi:SAM-dependent methyltransferase